MWGGTGMKWILLKIDPGVFALVTHTYPDDTIEVKYYLDGISHRAVLDPAEWIPYEMAGIGEVDE